MEKFHENCNFLANGCFVEQNSRKETPLKIKLYFKDFSNLPINTFSKAWKWHRFDFGPTFTHFYPLKYVNYIGWKVKRVLESKFCGLSAGFFLLFPIQPLQFTLKLFDVCAEPRTALNNTHTY